MMRALGAPLCLRKCIDPFLEEVANLWNMREIAKNIQPLCRNHAIALDCLHKYLTCDPHNLFKTASSSVEKMCGERAPLLEKVRPCLIKHGDIPAQVCDSRCHGRANITAFINNPAITMAALMGGNILTVNEHLGGLCRRLCNFSAFSGLNCALPCITMELNKVCPLSGWLTLDILLQPFETVADHLLDSSPVLKDFIANRINKKCKFLVQKSELIKLRKGQFNHLRPE
uniref:CPG4 domain-containing protein n=1 Tax=Angiostrongylus cantonensis TaxID=6313 RepID=A0A0K0CXE1_ANGCA